MSAPPVQVFLTAMQLRDADAAMAVVDPGVKVDIPPLGVIGGRDELQAVLADIFQAFPDLLVTVRNVINTGDVVTAEFKLEGTQTADYAGVVNQEKHLDVDQAWRFTVADDRIVGIEAYWCQNQLYRRLAVKRLDQIAIV